MKQKYTKSIRQQMHKAARRKAARNERGIKIGQYYERHPDEKPVKIDLLKRNEKKSPTIPQENSEGVTTTPETPEVISETTLVEGIVTQIAETEGKPIKISPELEEFDRLKKEIDDTFDRMINELGQNTTSQSGKERG